MTKLKTLLTKKIICASSVIGNENPDCFCYGCRKNREKEAEEDLR